MGFYGSEMDPLTIRKLLFCSGKQEMHPQLQQQEKINIYLLMLRGAERDIVRPLWRISKSLYGPTQKRNIHLFYLLLSLCLLFGKKTQLFSSRVLTLTQRGPFSVKIKY